MNKYIQENANIKLFPDGWDTALSVEKMETANNIVFTTENSVNEFKRVKHGEWNLQEINEDHEYEWFCSECKKRNDVKTNFCPNCEADMREGKESGMIDWISVKKSLPTKDGRYLTAHSAHILGKTYPYTYEVLGFSLNLSDVDKYDFSEEKYKNKKGFYYYDSEWGYGEQPNVEFWATINIPDEREITEQGKVNG